MHRHVRHLGHQPPVVTARAARAAAAAHGPNLAKQEDVRAAKVLVANGRRLCVQVRHRRRHVLGDAQLQVLIRRDKRRRGVEQVSQRALGRKLHDDADARRLRGVVQHDTHHLEQVVVPALLADRVQMTDEQLLRALPKDRGRQLHPLSSKPLDHAATAAAAAAAAATAAAAHAAAHAAVHAAAAVLALDPVRGAEGAASDLLFP